MALIDELQVYIKAGKGGDGVVRFLHEKSKEFGGPSGGNGGKGGDVYIKAVADVGILYHYKNKKEFEAQNGEDGFRDNCHGKNGKDLYIDLPVGSVVTNKTTRERFSLDVVGQTELVLKGGRGGLGNTFFKSSTNQTPQESTPGQPGEDAEFLIELEMFADVGLIGLPNAGKSSFLNAVTNAAAKVGGYEFTTLEPNLGALYEFILADIPGLIEGASEGKGLGHKFLKHVKRTKMLAHLVSCENEDVAATYKTVREELEKFDPELARKKEVIILSKTDMVESGGIEKRVKTLSKFSDTVIPLTLLDDESVKNCKDTLVKILRAQNEEK
ncbi:MAG TPA: GTPase ObgE [Candidatus Paceibacterota bacterium]|nr:GTPase ObgE [Candidatus Paceibacterota bacterium]